MKEYIKFIKRNCNTKEEINNEEIKNLFEEENIFLDTVVEEEEYLNCSFEN